VAENAIAYLDTHVLVRLYLGQTGKLSRVARDAIERNELFVSPAALLELEFLHEIGRLEPAGLEVMGVLSAEIGVRLCDLPFPRVVSEALAEKWVRDPFDRLIVAQAKVRDAPLITKDETLRAHYQRAVW
jgi:PIN domain nuclease of toxin-antitoxin system